jgi:pyruvate, water dikinase
MKLFDIFSKKDTCVLLKYLHEGQVTKYTLFRNLLSHNYSALNKMADMEQMFYSGRPFSLAYAMIKYQELYEAVLGIIYNLEKMSAGRFSGLIDVFKKIEATIFEEFSPVVSYQTKDVVLPFETINTGMKSMVGAKAANLASIQNILGLPVPGGFAVTAYAFEVFLKEAGLSESIKEALSRMQSLDSVQDIKRLSDGLREMVLQATVPSSIAEEIMKAYESLERKTYRNVKIAMRSSAVGEDTEASFAGQYESVLNVSKESVLDAYKTVLASKYSAHAINYRLQYGLHEEETPMAVAGIVMVDAKSSGVMYSIDPSGGNSQALKISAIWGLGEHLVDGSSSPDIFLADRHEEKITEITISKKEQKMVRVDSGGTALVEVPESEKDISSLDENAILKLRKYALQLEEYFGSPQDIEWAFDMDQNLYILQSRPLHIPKTEVYNEVPEQKFPENPVLLKGGKTASSGIATGTVVVLKQEDALTQLPENAILVAKTASPGYARVMGKIKGIITDIGSITSHMSSVAREFGIPAIVDAKNATISLTTGEVVTMFADKTIVYKGVVDALVKNIRPVKRWMFESPVHKRMRNILDRISPLNLTDSNHPLFAPEGCKTIHDIIRFTHEQAMKEMFGVSGTLGNEDTAVKLTANIPLNIYMIDLGGGLKEGLTTCHVITSDLVESVPFKALWKGFTHPGINWSSAIPVDMRSFMTLLASSATSELEEQAGSPSYGILSRDYMNLSARFGYHFVTIDTLCSETSDQNYLSLQFSGGAGPYYGRSLRIQFLGNVLQQLGFQVSIKGDLLEAVLSRYDMLSMENKLDQLGRLLASSRLLDMAISSQDDVQILTDAFFKGDYDFLSRKQEGQLENFYIHGGYWRQVTEEDHIYYVQDGSRSGYTISSGLAGIMGKIVGKELQDFLDNIEAYYYFPLAIVKNSEIEDGDIRVKVKPVKGNIDRAGGIAFGIRNIANYFAFRINALEDNVILFEYINNKRIERGRVDKEIDANVWYVLRIEIKGNSIKGFIDEEPVIEYSADKPLKGYVGLWTKADSVTYFDELAVASKNSNLSVGFD